MRLELLRGFVVAVGFLALVEVTHAEVKVFEGQYLIKKASIGIESVGTPKSIELFKTSDLSLFSAEPKIVSFNSNDSTCADLIASGRASFCEPNFYVEASVVSNDPNRAELYGLGLMGASQAWDRSTGRADMVIAVIDTGIDYSHPDLAANVWVNPGEIPANGIDDDGNGWVDDVYGINAFAQNGNPFDDNGHGTHVSGTIGAVGNNSIGVVGVNWTCKIMGLKFLSSGGGGSIFGAIQAIDYMIDAKQRYGLNLKVANNSWGGSGYSKALEDAIIRANNAGIVFVAAAGNEANNNDVLPSFPANYDLPNVVSVAAIDSAQSLAFFSNYGGNVDIAAPGVSILSTLPNAGYGKLSGTSMATPQVSGAIALLSAYDGSLATTGLIERLYASAIPLSSLSGKVRTSAMLNLAGMLGASSNPISNPPSGGTGSSAISKLSLRTGDGSSNINLGDALRILVTAKSQVSQIPLEMFLNDKKCEQAAVVSLNTGVNKFRAKANVPRSIAQGLKRLSIKVGGKKSSKKIAISNSGRSIRSRKLSSRSFKTACARISKSLR